MSLPDDSLSLSSPASPLRSPSFLFYVAARVFSELSYEIGFVAIGWQVYSLTGNVFDLGLIGLTQFLPTAMLVFFAGHAADRFNRRRIAQACHVTTAAAAVFLAVGTLGGWLWVSAIFATVLVLGAAIAFESPAVASMLPAVAPEGQMQRATALSTAAFQIARITGPALGGLLYAIAPLVPYAVMALFWLAAGASYFAVLLRGVRVPSEPPSLATLFAGVAFVRRSPKLLGLMSLDLFAVLFGGATALLPVYASDILHSGAWGLGMLRSAPAIGALLMALALARWPIQRQVGLRMFQSVILFGVATTVFAFSTSIWVSVLALAVLGAADMVSMVIRIALVQLATPDAMRGRVSAVNYLFVNASNQLGEFESGLAAAAFGTVWAAALGGIGTVVIALLWMRLFPPLRSIQKLE